jgi:hypothetical protein
VLTEIYEFQLLLNFPQFELSSARNSVTIEIHKFQSTQQINNMFIRNNKLTICLLLTQINNMFIANNKLTIYLLLTQINNMFIANDKLTICLLLTQINNMFIANNKLTIVYC